MFYWILAWKKSLMNALNADVFRADEWLAFLEAASNAGCVSMAADMQARFEHYAEERKCTRN